MNYTKNPNLSKEAQDAFSITFNALKHKAEREKRIPEELLFFVVTNCPDIEEELCTAGLQEYAFTDAEGFRVYRHKVDAEALREALGWNKQ